MKMEIKKINLPEELKEKIEDSLINEEETISIDEALSNAKKRWQNNN